MLKVLRVTNDSVTLQWSAPFSDGGSEVNKYVIMRKQQGALDLWEEVDRVSGTMTSFTVSRLREGKGYYFAVYAINKVGKGDTIETARPTTPKSTTSKCQLFMSFSSMFDLSIASEFCFNNQLQHKIYNCFRKCLNISILNINPFILLMLNHQNYLIVVKPVTPIGPLTIHAFSYDSVTLSWSRPDADASISSYRIEKREVSRQIWDVVGNVDASETSYTIRGLKAGTDYYFRVIAENGAGASTPLTLDRSFIPKMVYGKYTTSLYSSSHYL